MRYKSSAYGKVLNDSMIINEDIINIVEKTKLLIMSTFFFHEDVLSNV